MYLIIIILYCISMIWWAVRSKEVKTLNGFNIADRQLGWFQSSFSIAATWIWAPALFVASQKAYTQGILGFGWFFIPNVLCLMFFAILSKRALEKVSDEHTIAELMGNIYRSKRLKSIHNFELLFLLVCSTGVQLLAGGKVIHNLTGISFLAITIILAITALIYSSLRGIRASVRTDFIQMVFMLIAVSLALLFLFAKKIPLNMGGIDSVDTRIFSAQNWKYFIAFGLTVTIGLIAGPIGDQTFWQRAFSMKKEYIIKSFFWGAILFGLIPLGMSIIGFMAAGAGFIAKDSSIVGLEFVANTLPVWVVIIFMLCLISGLSSTLDSNICATGSIFSKFSRKTESIKFAKIGMVVITAIGILIANIPKLDIFWLFLFYGMLRTSVFIPTVWTMFSKKLPDERGLFYGIIGAFAIGIPIYTYGKLAGVSLLVVIGTLLTLLIPLISIIIYNRRRDAKSSFR